MTPEHISDLIAIGRDREAVAVALGGPIDGVQQLEQVAPMLGAIVGNIGDSDLARPTPCAQFAVADILEHMIGGASAFAPGFRGDGSAPNPPTEAAFSTAGTPRWVRSWSPSTPTARRTTRSARRSVK